MAVPCVARRAKGLNENPARVAAVQRHADGGGGRVVVHWGMGCQQAKYIEKFVNLFGGCHGGPDRKYKIVNTTPSVVPNNHPVTKGVKPIPVKEEFYYTLKFVKSSTPVTPLIRADIDGKKHTVAGGWQRPDGGRSFGFSGCHYHENWKHNFYRRLVVQAVLWTAKTPSPKSGLTLKFSQNLLLKPRPKPKK